MPSGANRFGIESGGTYNVTDQLASDPYAPVWIADRTEADIIASGINVVLDGTVTGMGQSKYLKLFDVNSPPDFDGDDMPDGWESTNSFNPEFAGDAQLDADGDGQSNLGEFLAGTDPRDGASRLAVSTFSRSETTMSLTWSSVPGKSYIIQTCDDLSGWLIHESSPGGPLVVPASEGSVTAEEISIARLESGANRFFRVGGGG
jgi:hypothetical protein